MVFKFQVSEDGLYYINVPCCSYNFQLNQGDTCPGTPIPDSDIDYQCFNNDEYAYLYAGTTYWIIAQDYSRCCSGSFSITVSRDNAGGL